MSTTTNFLYDGVNAVQETGTNPTANLLTGGVDERFTRVSATETDNYLTDALGSTMELTDSTGATEEQYSYGPYGMLSATGATTTNSYAYAGREFDGLAFNGTAINYNRARYYNPTTGRFLSEDPIGFVGSGANLYAYAENNPISLKDALGLCPNYCSALPGIADQSNLAAKTIALFAALLLLTAWMFAFVAIIGMSMMFLGLIVAVFAEMGQIATNLSHQSPCKQ